MTSTGLTSQERRALTTLDTINYKLKGKTLYVGASPGIDILPGIIATFICNYPDFNKLYRIQVPLELFNDFAKKFNKSIYKSLYSRLLSRMRKRGRAYEGKFSFEETGQGLFEDILDINGIKILPANPSKVFIETTGDDEIILFRNPDVKTALGLLAEVAREAQVDLNDISLSFSSSRKFKQPKVQNEKRKCFRNVKKTFFHKILSWFKGKRLPSLSRFVKEINGYITREYTGLYIPARTGDFEIRNWSKIARAYSELISSLSPNFWQSLNTLEPEKMQIQKAEDIYYIVKSARCEFYRDNELLAKVYFYHDLGIELKLYGVSKSKITATLKKYDLKVKFGPIPEDLKEIGDSHDRTFE